MRLEPGTIRLWAGQAGLPIRRTAAADRENFARAAAGKNSLPLFLIALHLPLGIALYNSSILAVLHPIAALLLGMYWAVRKEYPLASSAYVVGYLIGSEVLWRMVSSPIYWEFGKYASAAIMIVALVKRGRTKIPPLPLLYFTLLIPACFLTLYYLKLDYAKDQISFAMSGPFCLLVSCWFFSNVKLNRSQIGTLVFSIIFPLVSVGVTTLVYTVAAPDIQFTNESNFATSGGFGPNQVSAMLGLGFFVSSAALLLLSRDLKERIFLSLLAIFFATQSVLTFSRGGMYAGAGALLVLLLFQVRQSGRFLRSSLAVAALAVVFLFLVFPYLNEFTGGMLEERFESSDTTRRVALIESDFEVFLENPVLGVGVGMSPIVRWVDTGSFAANHTEYSRILSEHGLLGILAMAILGLATLGALRRKRSSTALAFTAGTVAWAGLFMMNAGMRLAAPSIMWGLVFVTIIVPVARQRVRSRLVRRTADQRALKGFSSQKN